MALLVRKIDVGASRRLAALGIALTLLGCGLLGCGESTNNSLWDRIAAHRAYLVESGQLAERRARNLAREVFSVASGRAKQHLEQAVADDPELRRLLDEVQRRELDPLSAVREILEKVFGVTP